MRYLTAYMSIVNDDRQICIVATPHLNSIEEATNWGKNFAKDFNETVEVGDIEFISVAQNASPEILTIN